MPVPEECGLYQVTGTVRFRWFHPEPLTDWRWRWLLIRPPSASSFPRTPGPAGWLCPPNLCHVRNEEVRALFTTWVPGRRLVSSAEAFTPRVLQTLGISLGAVPRGKYLVRPRPLCLSVAALLICFFLQVAIAGSMPIESLPREIAWAFHPGAWERLATRQSIRFTRRRSGRSEERRVGKECRL